jgi:hypothetical protein
MRQRAAAGGSDAWLEGGGTVWDWDHPTGPKNGTGKSPRESGKVCSPFWSHLLLSLFTFMLTVAGATARERYVRRSPRRQGALPLVPDQGSAGAEQHASCVRDLKATAAAFQSLKSQLALHKEGVEAAANRRAELGGGHLPEHAQTRAELSLLRMTVWDDSAGASAEESESQRVTQQRRLAVRRAFLHGYGAYERHAWGYDDLKPISQRGENWLGMGVTIVDSLDTMLLMGLSQSPEYARARAWVEDELDVAPDRDVSVFETTSEPAFLSTFPCKIHTVLIYTTYLTGRETLCQFGS